MGAGGHVLGSKGLTPIWGWLSPVGPRVQGGHSQVGGARGTKGLLDREVGRARTHLWAVL